MTHPRIAILLAATLAASPGLPAAAQGSDEVSAERAAKPAKPHAAARKAAKPTPAPAGRSPLLGAESTDEDRASSLERRRRAFFAKPDEGGAAPDGSPSRAGVTLGGRDGLTPGMGFKF